MQINHLPCKNWHKEANLRRDHSKADVYYHAPDGSKLRSMPEVRLYLESYNDDCNNNSKICEDDFSFKSPPMNEMSKYKRVDFSQINAKMDELWGELPQEKKVKYEEAARVEEKEYAEKMLYYESWLAVKKKEKFANRKASGGNRSSSSSASSSSSFPTFENLPDSDFDSDGHSCGISSDNDSDSDGENGSAQLNFSRKISVRAQIIAVVLRVVSENVCLVVDHEHAFSRRDEEFMLGRNQNLIWLVGGGGERAVASCERSELRTKRAANEASQQHPQYSTHHTLVLTNSLRSLLAARSALRSSTPQGSRTSSPTAETIKIQRCVKLSSPLFAPSG